VKLNPLIKRGVEIMSERKHNITSVQLMTFILSSQIGFGVLFLPASIAEICGHDGWLATLLAGVIGILCITLIISFLKMYKDKSIYQINVLLYGKYLGSCFNIIFLIYLMIFTGLEFRLLTEIIKITVLRLTPPLFIGAALMVTTIYMSLLGLKVICRFTATLLVTYVFTLLGFMFIYKHMRLTFIMPIGEAGIIPIAKGVLKASFSFLGIELIPVIYPYITDKQNARKYAITAGILTTFFTAVTVFVVTIVAGEEKLKYLALPLYNLATSIKAPIIERLDFFFIIFWFPVMGSTARLYFFSAFHNIDKTLNKKNKIYPIFIFTAIIVCIGRLPRDLSEVFNLMNLISFCGIGVVSFLIASSLISLIKRGVT
jgi:spore germination protein (amino acid permease)